MVASHTLVQEIRRQTPRRGMIKSLAHRWGLSQSHVTNLRNGTSKLTAPVAARILAKVREERPRLAERIEGELVESLRAELREPAR